jgi:hypothetical protein
MVLVGATRSATITITPAANADIWGVVIYRSTAAITDPNWGNAIAIVERDNVNAFTHTDSPLVAATYHYRCAPLNGDGLIGTAIADDSCVVTD